MKLSHDEKIEVLIILVVFALIMLGALVLWPWFIRWCTL